MSFEEFLKERAEKKRIENEKTEAEEARLAEKASIAKEKTEAFACKRCSEKYFSNIKLHDLVRDHHKRKSTNDEKPTATLSATMAIATPFILFRLFRLLRLFCLLRLTYLRQHLRHQYHHFIHRSH